jgi:hypothetical protein
MLALALAPAVAQRRARAPAGRDESEGAETPVVFRRFASQVLKVQVVETRSGARSVTGSGF